jgi:tetratricopeptide (TPR) repeat protein
MDSIIALIAPILRSLIAQIGPQAKAIADNFSDLLLVVIVGISALVVLILLLTIFSAMGASSRARKRRRKREEREEEDARSVREFPRDDPPPARKGQAPAAASTGRKNDPVEKMRRDATANAAKIKEDAGQLLGLLTHERDRVSGQRAFAQVMPTTALSMLADALAGADEPALAAARRKIQVDDFEGARADLRRYAEGAGISNATAWRNLGTLEGLTDLPATIKAFERAYELDPKQFVTAVTLRRLYSGSGRVEEGRKMATASIALAKGDREQAVAMDELGEACMFLKDGEGARQAFERGLSIVQGMSEKQPLDVEFRRDVAVSHFKLARLGGPQSREHLSQSISAFERIKAAGKLSGEDQQALKQLKEALAEMDRQSSEEGRA